MPRRWKKDYRKRCHCKDWMTCNHPWWLRVFSHGRRQRINLSENFPHDTPQVAAARAREAAKKGIIVNGRSVINQTDLRPRLGEVADKFLLTRKRKSYYLAGLREILGDQTVVDEITTADMRRAREEWAKRPKAGESSDRHLLGTAKHLFRWSIENGFSKLTPFKSAQGEPLLHIKASKARRRRLEEGEADRILGAAVADPLVSDLFTAYIETGCRVGELHSLQWSEVRGDVIIVLATKAKTKNERRIPIEPALRSILDRRRVGPDGNELPSDSYVFGDDTGRRTSKERLNERWRAVCKAAGVADLQLRDLRREAGSQLLEAGANIHEVRDALGHSNATMTSRYLALQKDQLKTAYARRTAHRNGPRGPAVK